MKCATKYLLQKTFFFYKKQNKIQKRLHKWNHKKYYINRSITEKHYMSLQVSNIRKIRTGSRGPLEPVIETGSKASMLKVKPLEPVSHEPVLNQLQPGHVVARQ